MRKFLFVLLSFGFPLIAQSVVRGEALSADPPAARVNVVYDNTTSSTGFFYPTLEGGGVWG